MGLVDARERRPRLAGRDAPRYNEGHPRAPHTAARRSDPPPLPQSAHLLKFKSTDLTQEASGWLVFWKGRDLQMEWMTNAAIEVWMSYKMPAASLELASTLIKSTAQPYLQPAALADPEHMEKTVPVMRKYALRAEAYVWQCWSALNTAEYMIALSAAGTDQVAYTKALTSSAATTRGRC